MNAQIILILAAGWLGAADAPNAAATKELAKIQGEWQLEAFTYNGNVAAEESLADTKAKVVGDQVTLSSLKVTIKLDPSTDPKIIDVGIEGHGTLEGIYQLDGDTLKVCVSIAASKQRPYDFAAGENCQQILYVY